MIIEKFSKTGAFHRDRDQVNQDYLFSVEGGDYIAVMAADGATACKNGLEGARITCEAVSQLIENEGMVFFRYPKEKIAYLLTEQILYKLEKGKEQDCDISEYGSTFLLAFMEKKTGRTVFVNLGDGAAMLADGMGCVYIAPPRRYRETPCLTTTIGAEKAVDVTVADIALGDRILLGTDGFLEQLGKHSIKQRMMQGDMEGLNQTLQKEHNEDDCSYISFVRKRK